MDVEKLKRKGPPPAVLDRLMRQVCAELELVSVVGAAQLDSDGGSRQKPGSKPPRGERNRGLERLRKRYVEAECNWDRLRVLGDAQTALEQARGSRLGQYRDGRKRHSVAWKQAVARDARASRLVGADFGCSAVYVRKLRIQYARGNAEQG